MTKFFQQLFRKIRRLFRKPKHLRYDAHDRVGDDEPNGYGGKGGLSKAAETARKKILQTKLEEGDTYRLGPEALVTMGPPGLEGKAWITKRIVENQERRRKKFEQKWEKQRKRAIELMMMSEAELRATGVWDEVQAFITQNYDVARQLGLNVKGIKAPQVDKSTEQQQTYTKFFEVAQDIKGEMTEEQALESSEWSRFVQANGLTIDSKESFEAATRAFEQSQAVAVVASSGERGKA